MANKESIGKKNMKMTKAEKKLIDYIGEKIMALTFSKLETDQEIQTLESLGVAAGRLAEWLEEEQVDVEMDEVKCAMICEALGESLSKSIM